MFYGLKSKLGNQFVASLLIFRYLFLSITVINASQLFTLCLFFIFIRLYNGSFLARFAKSKKVNN